MMPTIGYPHEHYYPDIISHPDIWLSGSPFSSLVENIILLPFLPVVVFQFIELFVSCRRVLAWL